MIRRSRSELEVLTDQAVATNSAANLQRRRHEKWPTSPKKLRRQVRHALRAGIIQRKGH